jgi:hypothetical protein
MKIRLVGAEFFHVEGQTNGRKDGWTEGKTDRRKDGRTDTTKLIVTFRDFANTPKNVGIIKNFSVKL